MILVGISVVSACGQTSTEPAPAQESATATAPKTAAISAPERPALAVVEEPVTAPRGQLVEQLVEQPVEPAPVAVPAARAALNPSAAFERQTRDPSWAGPTETEIRNRVTKLGGRLESTECRHDHCLLTLRANEDQMMDLIAKLESARGLQGYAQSVYLTAPVEQDGKLVLRAYATFDR